jgi:hypothetical protein
MCAALRGVRPTHERRAPAHVLSEHGRITLLAAVSTGVLAGCGKPVVFQGPEHAALSVPSSSSSWGPLTASAHIRSDASIVFALFASDFPRTARPLLVLEDVPGSDPSAFGSAGTVYVEGPGGLHAHPTDDAGAETLALLSRTLAALRESAISTYALREATRATIDSRSASNRLAARKRAFDRMLAVQRDAAQAILDLAGREAAKASGSATWLRDVEAAPPAPPAPVVSRPGWHPSDAAVGARQSLAGD